MMTTAQHGNGIRRVALWVPDWSTTSFGVAVPPGTPAVTIVKGAVVGSTRTARVCGVRRGMRLSTAQNVCEDLVVLPHDRQRDDSAFEVLLKIFDQQVADVCALRPGLAWAPVGGATRWALDETELVASLAEHVASETGMEAYVGIGDGAVASVAAARRGIVVDPADTQDFLDSLMVEDLVAFLSGEEKHQYAPTITLLRQLGIRQVRELRNLGVKHVVTRCGQAGQKLWTLATGGDLFHGQRVAAERPIEARIDFDPPAPELAQTLMQVRKVSQDLVDQLSHRGLTAQSVRIVLETGDGAHHARTWTLFDTSSSSQISQRIIWQIRSWQDGEPKEELSGEGVLQAIVLIAIDPTSQHVTDTLWGAAPRLGKVQQTVNQVQLLLGDDAVTQPHLRGGMDPRSRLVWVPWGGIEESISGEGEWAGSLEEAPVVLFDSPPSAKLIGEKNDGTWGGLWVDRRGVLVGIPQRVIVLESRPELESGSYLIDGTQGLWALRGDWWLGETQEAQARCYVRVTRTEGEDLLLVQAGGQWRVEGIYAQIMNSHNDSASLMWLNKKEK